MGTLVTAKGLKTRPGPPLPRGENYFTAAWKRGEVAAGQLVLTVGAVFNTIRDIRELPNLGRFLLLYFFFSDGYSAIGSLGVIFAQYEVGMPVAFLGLLLIETQLFALAGCIVYARVQKWLMLHKNVPEHRSGVIIVMISLFVIGILPLYGLMGISPGATFGLVRCSRLRDSNTLCR